MARWIGALLVASCASLMGWGPAEATDRSVAKALTRTGAGAQGRLSRACSGNDLLGNWQLVTFNSSYRFRHPQAPYLFPHQVFQYSNQGGAKSAHSLQPILGRSDEMFETVPLDMTYQVARKGRVLLKARGGEETLETWSCSVVTQDREARGDAGALRRGDLVMTLMGSEGQALFVRHLRKRAA
ncbi:MAG: hypothetical protein R3B37_02330 [Nitrospira sp.]|nr:hypothetical protein [Nitrospira sp.]